MNYYNEHNKFAAQWLRNLIRDGHIAPGEVDERSIEDVRPSDLGGFVQCHFFAGIGVWSASLRGAGWPDDRRVWTASCPCQPFSAAGKGDGFADERHLWPAFFHLVEQCKPTAIIGEQVASGPAGEWIDLVQTDLEDVGYTFGAIPFPATGVGAPHLRDRMYWVADTCSERRTGQHSRIRAEEDGRHGARAVLEVAGGGELDALGNANIGVPRRRSAETFGSEVESGGIFKPHDHGPSNAGVTRRVADDDDARLERRRTAEQLRGERAVGSPGVVVRADATNGFWRDADWIFCTDDKWRPIEPESEPLAHGLVRSMGALSPRARGLASVAGLDADSLKRAKSFRMGCLRGYGNAIVKPAAETFIRAYMETL